MRGQVLQARDHLGGGDGIGTGVELVEARAVVEDERLYIRVERGRGERGRDGGRDGRVRIHRPGDFRREGIHQARRAERAGGDGNVVVARQLLHVAHHLLRARAGVGRNPHQRTGAGRLPQVDQFVQVNQLVEVDQFIQVDEFVQVDQLVEVDELVQGAELAGVVDLAQVSKLAQAAHLAQVAQAAQVAHLTGRFVHSRRKEEEHKIFRCVAQRDGEGRAGQRHADLIPVGIGDRRQAAGDGHRNGDGLGAVLRQGVVVHDGEQGQIGRAQTGIHRIGQQEQHVLVALGGERIVEDGHGERAAGLAGREGEDAFHRGVVEARRRAMRGRGISRRDRHRHCRAQRHRDRGLARRFTHTIGAAAEAQQGRSFVLHDGKRGEERRTQVGANGVAQTQLNRLVAFVQSVVADRYANRL
jgi:hypothetical protein